MITLNYGYIYVIENKVNGKLYVGQTIDPDRRCRAHFAWASSCGSSALKAAIQKYGKSNFDFVLIESCVDKDSFNRREIYWIRELNSMSPFGYNLTQGGGSDIPGPLTRSRMSKGQRGKVLSQSHRGAISAALRGRRVPDRVRQLKSETSPYRQKTHCKKGHAFSGDNVVIYTRKDGRTFRRCRQCERDSARERYHRRQMKERI